MSSEFQERVATFNNLVREVEVLLFVTRDSDLQRAAIERLSQIVLLAEGWKRDAVSEGNEDQANAILGMEHCAASLKAELEMWVLLKSNEADEAWNCLITAQSAALWAIRASAGFVHLVERTERLATIEKLIFPSQIFLSAGLIVHQEICTICGSDYEDCAHVVGTPYWGEFCFRRLVGVTPDHVAMVEEPANKKCRITHFNVEEGKRNRMTWRVEPFSESDQVDNDGEGLRTRAILLTEDDLSKSG